MGRDAKYGGYEFENKGLLVVARIVEREGPDKNYLLPRAEGDTDCSDGLNRRGIGETRNK